MKQLVLTPHVGVGPVKLGAQRSDIRAALADIGCPLRTARGSMDHFGGASIQVEYEEDDTASFIGVSSHQDVVLLFDDIDLFDKEAEEIFAIFSSRDDSGNHQFTSYEYVFPKQIVTLYEADPQYDHRRGETRPVWAQIGCGDQRYLDGILQIRKGVLNRVVQKKE
jgi:hypothetical protein